MSDIGERLSIATYPWKTTDAMRLLEDRDALERERDELRERVAWAQEALSRMSLLRKEWVPAERYADLLAELGECRARLKDWETRYLKRS